MKGYKRFIIVFALMLALYVSVEMNRPKPVDWSVSLSREDKNPYGGHIVYKLLKDLFPGAVIGSYRLPVYNQVNNFQDSNTAYILVDPKLELSGADLEELISYVKNGNYVFMSSGNFSKALMDSLKFTTARRFDFEKSDSITINLLNPALQAKKSYGFRRMTLERYLNTFDTSRVIALGNNHLKDINFIKMPLGAGAFFIHTLPLCFSNYFMVTGKNSDYTAKVLSYLPSTVSRIFWDEYYKPGNEISESPLRVILNDPWLKWAFYLGIFTMLLYVLFEMKRRQRIIPVELPPVNSTLEFVETVGKVYFNQRDNKDLAEKKISYFMEHVRSVLFISHDPDDEDFVPALSRKSGLPVETVEKLARQITLVQVSPEITDEQLLELNRQMDDFYTSIK